MKSIQHYNRECHIEIILSMAFLLAFCIILASGGYFLIAEQNKQIANLKEDIRILNEKQNKEIIHLQEKIEILNERFNRLDGSAEVVYPENTYNYLAIGNSITLHPINDYWWNEIGMAATTQEKDYVHQIADKIRKQKRQNVTVYACNFYQWEVQSKDRAESLGLLDAYLDERLDLVTIQLSENATDLSTFETDFEELIRYIKAVACNAEIIIIGDFFDSGEKDSLKSMVAKTCDAVFVSLDEIKGVQKYQAGMGTIVYDPQGNEHKIEHEGVATHPGDKGMEYIAQKVMEKLRD